MDRGMENPRNIVGPQVMLLRNERGWSQEKLATVCQLRGWDISRGVVARIEGGVRWVADFELLELAAALKVPVPDLYPKQKRAAFRPRKGIAPGDF
jgi:transcriptional regulator with XRE-family HTH domain